MSDQNSNSTAPTDSLAGQLEKIESLWSPLDPAGSEAKLRSLLPAAREATQDGRIQLIALLTWLARAAGAQGRVPEARASMDEAEALLEEQATVYPVAARIRWLIERGRLHILEKTPSQARIYYSEAWTLAVNSGEDFFAVEVAMLMAESEPQKVQAEWLERATKIAENSPLPKSKKWLGSLYMAKGWRLFDVRQFEAALEMFQRALSNIKVYGSEREAFVARWSAGKVLRSLGKTEEALSIQQTLLAELGIGGRRDGRLYEELAECLQSLKRGTEAQLYFELAYRELSGDTWVTDNQPVQLRRLKDLGKVKN